MNINKDCAAYCITVIRHLMHEEPIPAMPEGIRLSELYDFSRLHGVEAMVFHGLEQLNMDENDPVWQNWCNRADMLLTQSIVQLAERDTLFAALPAAGVPILPVKGCWLKELYPDIDYRQMSDLDILIHEEDAVKANSVMEKMGYTGEEDLVENHDSFIKKPYMSVELHRSLLPVEDNRYHYYGNVWENAVPVSGFPGVFQLKPEDEYIYYILHLYKHILHAGTGIRSFLDSMIYRWSYPDMDQSYLAQEFEKLHMTSFAECVETMSDFWFDTGSVIPKTMEPMVESILAAGTYGTVGQKVQNEMKHLQGRFNNPAALKTAYALSSLFLPLKAMRELYPVLEKAPVLLPVFWIWRPISRLLFRPKALKNFMKHTKEAGDKIWSEFDWREFQSK